MLEVGKGTIESWNRKRFDNPVRLGKMHIETNAPIV